tara:strand:+ start:1924 stop:2643 length:720 start_codon:yes stop_codon:yes gene_type:complete
MTITKESLISEVANGYDTYTPNNEVTEQLSRIDLTIVTAPSGMGKDSLINATGLPRVLPETIRDPRSNNGIMEQDGVEYEFRGQDLDSVYKDYSDGNYVQIGMGPGRNSFYATRAQNYPTEGPALINLMASQVETMRKLPFASVQPIHVTVPTYEEWLRRVTRRGVFTQEDWDGRHAEAIESITLALDDERFIFIVNDDLNVASRALYSVASRRDRQPRIEDKKPRLLAANLLKQLQES